MKNTKELMLRNEVNQTLKHWREQEKLAIEIIKIVGQLRFDKSIEVVLFRRDIYDAKPSKVISDHEFAANYVHKPISVQNTLELLQVISKIENFIPSKIDIGTIGAKWVSNGDKFASKEEFIFSILGDFINDEFSGLKHKDVILYGFGRIGRLLARRILAMTGKGDQLRLKAIVLRPKMNDRFEEAKKRVSLLIEDTVHGPFNGAVKIADDGNSFSFNGNKINIIFAKQPEEIDYSVYGIRNALVLDNTGVWRDGDALKVHLRPGVDKVLLTAPGGKMPNIVYGVNHKDVMKKDPQIISAASCTTNAIVPLIKLMDDNFGIKKGHIETVHAYTSDQNLLDNFHKKPRRGRGAATNMVLTTTGAAKAVSKVLPHLDGILTGNAVRVPVPNVSLAIINLTVDKKTSVEAINKLVKQASIVGDFVEQIHFSESTEYVSSQAVGMTSTSVFDAPSTIVSADGETITLYAWYDNEYGYTSQVVRLAKYASKVNRKTFY